MKVRALSLGYINHQRKYPGDVFTLVPYKKKDGSVVSVETQFSKKWMEKVDKGVPEVSQPKVPITAASLGNHEEQRRVNHSDLPVPSQNGTEITPEQPAKEEAGEQSEKPAEEAQTAKAPSTGDADVI